jgi:Transposase DDE domain
VLPFVSLVIAVMPRQRKPPLQPDQLQGYKYFALLRPLLQRLHGHACRRDRAGNRRLHYDQYAALLLFYFFNPLLTSLRGLQQASALDKVQRRLGGGRAALGSLSEASRVFDPALLRPLLGELAAQARPVVTGKEAEALAALTAVDGSLWRGLPRMAWALWLDPQHRGAKLHLHFDVLKAVPVDATVTPGACSEPDQLRAMLQEGRLYVIDRGYAGYVLFADILQAGSSFVGRLKEDAAFTVQEERPLTAAARAAGVIRDVVVSKLGSDHHKDVVGRPLRLVWVATGKRRADGSEEVLLLCTDLLELPAELVALAYKYRWQVELFFRWFKCILGARHLLAQSEGGLTLQLYAGLLASLLISVWTGRQPTKRTFEMVCLYFSGWASLDELDAHIEALQEHPKTKPRPA